MALKQFYKTLLSLGLFLILVSTAFFFSQRIQADESSQQESSYGWSIARMSHKGILGWGFISQVFHDISLELPDYDVRFKPMQLKYIRVCQDSADMSMSIFSSDRSDLGPLMVQKIIEQFPRCLSVEKFEKNSKNVIEFSIPQNNAVRAVSEQEANRSNYHAEGTDFLFCECSDDVVQLFKSSPELP